MIVYENAPEPAVRSGEFDLAGRRVAVRAVPYAGEAGVSRWRFDPLDRRFVSRPPRGAIAVGPHDPGAWAAALARMQPGTVLVGPGDPAEEIRGAYRAAADGAAAAGRGVYLLEPSPAGLPEGPPEAFIPLFVALPDAPPEGLEGALGRGFAAGCLLPLIPGWTAAPEMIEKTVSTLARSGASFVAGIVPAQDGQARRKIVEARAELDPGVPDDFFENVHHGDWSGEAEAARMLLRQACAARGLASLAPRPLGRGEPAVNSAAAGRLEEKADTLSAREEHRASLLHAAARWIDEWGRDLAPIVKEGNFRKIFPFGEDLAGEAEEALRGGP
jgi:hypothetical protein